jgi:hypothetical protein
MYVFGCKLSLFGLCDSDFGITPVDDKFHFFTVNFSLIVHRTHYSTTDGVCCRIANTHENTNSFNHSDHN